MAGFLYFQRQQRRFGNRCPGLCLGGRIWNEHLRIGEKNGKRCVQDCRLHSKRLRNGAVNELGEGGGEEEEEEEEEKVQLRRS